MSEPTGIAAVSDGLADRLAAATTPPDGVPLVVEIVAPGDLGGLPGEPPRLALVLLRAELGAGRAVRPTPLPGILRPEDRDLAVELHYLIVPSAVVELDAQALFEQVLRTIEASPVLTIESAGPTPIRLVIDSLPAADVVAFWQAAGIPPRLALFVTAATTLAAPPAISPPGRPDVVRARTRPGIDR